MSDKEDTGLKNTAHDSSTADPAEGRDTTGSRAGRGQRTWIGDAPLAGQSDAATGQERSGRLVTDGGEVVADSDDGTDQADAVSFVISSDYRCAVLDALEDGAATPSTIADEQDVGIAHVSRALQRLRDRDIVDLIVDDDRKKGRLYDLTDVGSSLINDYSSVIERNNGGDA